MGVAATLPRLSEWTLLTMIVTGKHSVSSAERQTHVFKKKIGIGPVITQERILFWSITLKVRTCSCKKVLNSGPVQDSASYKTTLVGGTYP